MLKDLSVNYDILIERIRSKQVLTYKGAEPSLRQIGRELEIPSSSFTRLAAGKPLEAEAIIKILMWLRSNGDTWEDLMRAITKKKAR